MEEPALTTGLDINVDKSKYMNTYRTRQQSADTTSADINGKVYKVVTDFKYLGSIIASDNNCERAIKARMAAENRSYCTLTAIMKLQEI
jgi:hypothetical protein